jgi:hypothetical protein
VSGREVSRSAGGTSPDYTKSYGRAFLKSLPPVRRIDQLDELEGWFNGTSTRTRRSSPEDDVDF